MEGATLRIEYKMSHDNDYNDKNRYKNSFSCRPTLWRNLFTYSKSATEINKTSSPLFPELLSHTHIVYRLSRHGWMCLVVWVCEWVVGVCVYNKDIQHRREVDNFGDHAPFYYYFY